MNWDGAREVILVRIVICLYCSVKFRVYCNEGTAARTGFKGFGQNNTFPTRVGSYHTSPHEKWSNAPHKNQPQVIILAPKRVKGTNSVSNN